MAHAVEHDLHDRSLLVAAAARLGHGRQRETIARARAVGGAAAKDEGDRPPGADRGEIHFGVARLRRLEVELRQDDGVLRGGGQLVGMPRLLRRRTRRDRGGLRHGAGRAAFGAAQGQCCEGQHQDRCDGVERQVLAKARRRGHVHRR